MNLQEDICSFSAWFLPFFCSYPATSRAFPYKWWAASLSRQADLSLKSSKLKGVSRQ